MTRRGMVVRLPVAEPLDQRVRRMRPHQLLSGPPAALLAQFRGHPSQRRDTPAEETRLPPVPLV